MCIEQQSNSNLWELVNTFAIIITAIIAFYALYYSKLKGARLKIGEIVDLGAFFNISPSSNQKVFLSVIAPIYNIGSKPLWITNVNLRLKYSQRHGKADCVLYCFPENLDHKIEVPEFKYIHYPIVLKPDSVLTFVFVFDLDEDGNGFESDIEYTSTLNMTYNNGKEEIKQFSFIIPNVEFDKFFLNNKPNIFSGIYQFSVIGFKRKYKDILN